MSIKFIGLIINGLLVGSLFFGAAQFAQSAALNEARTIKKIEVNQPLKIGLEYAMPGMASAFNELGLSTVKQYPDEIRWDRMQKSARAKIDFSKTDRFVKEYQEAGFTTLVIALKSHSAWASKKYLANPAPKKEYLELYKKWLAAVVERYDADGFKDMPGLKAPVIYYEIGTEFSSYEPEVVEDYLIMLEAAYNAAHAAADKVIVAHAAFLTTTVFDQHPLPPNYERAFEGASKRIMAHSLTDIRAVLDRPEIFDAVNFHSLGNPYEIEDNVQWLKYEMARRHYDKPIIISDTAITPFAGYGPATICRGQPAQLSLLMSPAEEKDRCRLAKYFNQLIAGDNKTLNFERAFAGSDLVKRILIAADQKIALINAAFMEESAFFKTKIFQAAAGNTSWAGMAQTKMNWRTGKREVVKKFPAFYALKQLAGYLDGSESVTRMPTEDENLRWYKIIKPGGAIQVIWHEPGKLILPDNDNLSKKIRLSVTQPEVTLEKLIAKQNQTKPEQQKLISKDGSIELTLTWAPVFIFADASLKPYRKLRSSGNKNPRSALDRASGRSFYVGRRFSFRRPFMFEIQTTQ